MIKPALTIWYIDTRPLVPTPLPSTPATYPPTLPLPLLSTLPEATRARIQRFYRPADQYMSLASALLKTLFIHRSTGTAWADVQISRTSPPHERPFWDPQFRSGTKDVGCGEVRGRGTGWAKAVEFNVSHQAGLVVLAGMEVEEVPRRVVANVDGLVLGLDGEPRLGIDVTCVNEVERGPDVTTMKGFDEWVDVFAEVFSEKEILDMKTYVTAGGEGKQETDIQEEIKAKLRRFYTFFALKEAYVKMTGEALLAGWIRELEFRNVTAPFEVQPGSWGKVEDGIEIWFRGEKVDGLLVEVVGFGADFIVALIGRGLMSPKIRAQQSLAQGMQHITIETHIRECAEKRCNYDRQVCVRVAG